MLEAIGFMFTGIIAIFVLAWLSSMLILVQPRQARMVYSWVGGSVQRTITDPGLYFKAPWPFQSTSEKISLAEQIVGTMNRARSSEEAFFNLEVRAIMQIRSDSVQEATFNMENPINQIKASISEAVKRVVPTLSLNEVYADREKIRDEVKETLNEIYTKHGWECLEVIVEDPALEASIEEASNKRIENRRRAEAAEDLKKAIYLEQTAEAEADAEALRVRTKAQGQSKKLFTQEVIESVKTFRAEFPDLDPQMLMDAFSDLDRRAAIVSASSNPGSLILMDTDSERGRQYANMAAFDHGQATVQGGETTATTAGKTTSA
ncbi:MAG: Membrane protease protein family [Marinobacter sp. T13-3]|nr:MAG: Membrane protease protein family [Marinobacter sp. T13-3]